MLAEAELLSEVVNKNLKARRAGKNYTELEKPKRYDIGYLGEGRLVEALKQRGFAVEYKIRPTGYTENNKIIVHLKNKDVAILCKTRGQPSDSKCLLSYNQQQKIVERGTHIDYVGAARLNRLEHYVEIMGFAPFSDTFDWKIEVYTTECRTCLFSDIPIRPDAFVFTLRRIELGKSPELTEEEFIQTLAPEDQKVIAETKKDYPGWMVVPEPNAKLTGYAWVRID